MKSDDIFNDDALRDQYEDALLGLMMDEIAKEEGRLLIQENDRLKRNPLFQVPERLDAAVQETIKREFAKIQRRSMAHWIVGGLKKTAVVFLVILSLIAGTFLTVEAFRVQVLNFYFETLERSTDVRLIRESDHPDKPEMRTLMPGWLPAGYEMTDVTDELIIYSHSNGNTIFFNVWDESAGIMYDTEDVVLSESVTISIYVGVLVQKADSIQLTWHDKSRNVIVNVSATNIDKETIIRVATSIYLRKEEKPE